MKIDNSILPVGPTKPENGVSGVKGKSKPSGFAAALGIAESKDRATLSTQAQTLSKAASAARETPDVRAARVDTIKEQVDSGQYAIPYDSLAKTLLKKLGL